LALSEAAIMKPAGLLCVLLAASAANAAPGPMSDIASPPPPAVVLAAGRDSVGGLMPLPLWPPYTPRVYAPAPQVWKHKVRKCTHACPR
jgi:hypothetical protein